MKYLLSLALVCFIFSSASNAQQNTTNWQVKFEDSKSFIENKGQFDGRDEFPNTEILFAVDNGEQQIYFTKKGVSYRFEKLTRNPDRKRGDRSKPRRLKTIEFVHFNWEGANFNVELVGEDLNPDYYVYSFLKEDSYYQVEDIRSYKKILYKNIYNNIDIEYVLHPKNGIKYSLIVHPGGDVSKVRMNYPEKSLVTLNDLGRIVIPTSFGDIIEHEPHTFYADNSSIVIPSQFTKKGNSVSFLLGNYDKSQTIIVDPWVETPTLSNTNCVWEVEADQVGNVYIIGGDSPMRLRKYNSSGVLQWTHNTPYSVQSDSTWLGTLATDRNGNSYVTNGSTAAIQKINTNGGLDWSRTTGGLFDAYEYWNIAFNCDQTKLVVGGTVLAQLTNVNAAIFDINTNNGNVTASQVVVSGSLFSGGIGGQEVRSITSSYNAKYYFLTHDTIGVINQTIGGCSTINEPLFKLSHGYRFGYKCENYRPRHGNSGIMAIRANKDFLYSHNGETIHRRSLIDGSILGTATIPGGSNVTDPLFGLTAAGNSGIAIDRCGNVYVGSGNGVVKYDANLTFISSVNTPFSVYDIAISNNGEIIAVGATGTNTSSSRVGYIQAINMTACLPDSLICCNASLCPTGPYCSTAAAINLTPLGTTGGIWSGTGITNASAGTFNPSVAGVGVHTITYTLPCGSESINITVNNCANLEVCVEPNGNYTVSGGIGPYTWETGVPFQNCSACPFGQCFPPICSGVADTTWTTFSTNTTATPPGTFPIRVRDSGINRLVLGNAAGLPACTTIPCPTITVSISSQTNVSCAGGNNGSATVSATGGATPYTYTWQPGNVTGATRNNLTAGTYTVVASSDANACTGTVTVTITQPTAISANATATPATCAGNTGTATVTATNGTSPYTYTWSNGATTQSISGLATGSFTVTVRDNNNCTTTATANVSSSGGATVTLNSKTDVNCFGEKTGAIDISVAGGTSPYTYAWSNSATTQDLNFLGGGTYTVTVTDNNNCQTIFNATINEPSVLVVNGTSGNPGCGANDGSVTLTVNGGTSPYAYSWSNGATTQNLTNVGAGNFSVTVTDNNGCADSLSFTLTSPGGIVVSLSATDASCQGVNNGTVTATVSGGATPYTFAWSNGETTQNLTGVGTGNYTLTVTDAASCTEVQVISVGALNTIAMSTVITGVQCEYDTIGAIKLIVTGGTAPYTETWSTGAVGETVTNLSAGNYGVTVVDANGCTADSVFAVLSLSGLSVNASVSGISCDGTGSATAIATPTGNEPPFTYEWSNGETTQTISNLSAGVYIVTATDNLDCIAADTVSVGTAAIAILEKNIIQPECDTTTDGAIEIILVGGNDGYTFEWNNGQDSSVAINLTAGVYTVTIVDLNDCFLIDTTELNAARFCADTLIIYDVFSPNGDGKNDLWIIDGLENYPDNELQIYNRWGSLVYEQKPYTNANAWDGTNKKGNPLPSATYYYILKLNDIENQIFSGHVTIIR